MVRSQLWGNNRGGFLTEDVRYGRKQRAPEESGTQIGMNL